MLWNWHDKIWDHLLYKTTFLTSSVCHLSVELSSNKLKRAIENWQSEMNPNKFRFLPQECLLNNIMDKDFQCVLLPFTIFQNIFMIARFNVTNNFITPLRRTYYIKSACAVSILIIINYYCFVVYSEIIQIDINKGTTALVILLRFDCIYYIIATVVLYITSALHSSNTVLLIIKLQESLRTINMTTKMLLHMKIWNWIYILSISSFYFVSTIIIVSQTQEFKFGHLILLLRVMIFDLNIIYASRTVSFTCHVLRLWNKKMLGYEKKYYQEMEENQLMGKAMLKAYFDIIKSFRLTEKIYEFAVSIFATVGSRFDLYLYSFWNRGSWVSSCLYFH